MAAPDDMPQAAVLERERAAHIARTESRYETVKQFASTVGWAVGIALALRSLAFEPFSIPSESMLPQLQAGDYLFVSKSAYGYSRYSFPLGLPIFSGRILDRAPTRGDIAVFKTPYDNRTDYIKRVIGLPGDRVQMRGGTLYLNGLAVPRVRVAAPGAPRFRETLPNGVSYEILDLAANAPGDDTGIFTVPDGHYFMMGDNRDDSADSRYPIAQDGIGFVPAENFIGRAALTFFSTDGTAEPWKPWTWIPAMRGERIGTRL
jgi:signal peptidase I